MMTNVLTQAAEHRVEQLEAGSSLSAATLQFERQKRLEAERLAQVRHRSKSCRTQLRKDITALLVVLA